MPRILPVVAALCMIGAIACGGGDDDSDAALDAPTAAGLATATPAAAASGPEQKPTEPSSTGPAQVSVANEPFSIEAPDGVILHGHAYTPDGPKRQALIIVAPIEQAVWAESVSAFTDEGIAVFTIDLPGYGETGGDQADMRALATDVRLLTRFVISREYPLVYLMGPGETGGALVSDEATFQDLQAVSGHIVYGYNPSEAPADALALGGDATWDGENILAIPEVQQRVLDYVLGGN